MRDRSLEEFIDADEASGRPTSPAGTTDDCGDESGTDDRGDESGTDDCGDERATDDGADLSDGAADVDSTASTYAWTPGGTECVGCGCIVERRWRDDGRLVCIDCKSW